MKIDKYFHLYGKGKEILFEEVPSAELSTNLAEVGTDMVSRQAVIDAIEKAFKRATNDVEKNTVVYGLLHSFSGICKTMIMQLPSAKPQERKGKWIHDGFDHPHGIDWCHCSVCGNQEDMKSVYTNVHVYPYCAKCGARMEVTE